MTAISFSFENTAVRTLGTADSPLFVATDVCNALNHSNPWKAIKDLCDEEDVFKHQLIDARGRAQTVNCVNESGLYALIFGSKLESAKRFKRWVTSEVLPAIRKTGRYEQPVIEYINDEQRWAIQSEVAKRVHSTQANYQTVYRALKAHFHVPKYTHILANQFDEAINFIRSFNANVPEHTHHTNDDERCPCCGLRPVPRDTLLLPKRHAEAIANFTYSMRYLFRSDLELIYSFLRNSQSPKAPHFCELVNNLDLALLEDVLRQYGYDVTKMPCYLAFTASK